MNVKQNIKKLLFQLNKRGREVKYTVIYRLKIDGVNEQHISELAVMQRLIEVYKNGC